jgi:hypothetical protein
MHSELRDASLYLEYAAFGFLVCPSLLFHPEGKYAEMFRLCVTDQLVVTLHRDMVSRSVTPLRLHPVTLSPPATHARCSPSLLSRE